MNDNLAASLLSRKIAEEKNMMTTMFASAYRVHSLHEPHRLPKAQGQYIQF